MLTLSFLQQLASDCPGGCSNPSADSSKPSKKLPSASANSYIAWFGSPTTPTTVPAFAKKHQRLSVKGTDVLSFIHQDVGIPLRQDLSQPRYLIKREQRPEDDHWPCGGCNRSR